jgi:uncharacterized protein (TIGR00725 family)
MIQIGVIGTGEAREETDRLAFEVGAAIARVGALLCCGGLGGVMAAAARGARQEKGLTLGLLPGPDRAAANPYMDVVVPTDMGHARNALVVRSADVLIAVGGGYGTLSEIALALKMGKPVVGLNTWEIEGVHEKTTAAEAVRAALALV